jgi:hypothetical protein
MSCYVSVVAGAVVGACSDADPTFDGRELSSIRSALG